MQWLRSRLSRMFAVGTAAGLVVSSLVFLMLFLALYRGELAAERAGAAEQVNQLLQTSLENAMLKRDLEGLRLIVDRLGQQPGIEAVFITDPRGEVRFSSDSTLLGRAFPPHADKKQASTHFVTNQYGRDILRSINPVANRPPCIECHGPSGTNPVNGILFVDYDAAPIRDKAQDTTLLLMGSGAIIVLLNLAGGWWFIQRYVIRPVEHLTTASRSLESGHLHQRVQLQGQNELASMGRAFNSMANQLQERIDEAENQRGFLQSLVDAIPDGVRIIDRDYRVILTNRAYCEQLGLQDDGVGDSCHRVSHQSRTPCPSTLITCPVHELAVRDEPVRALHRHHDTSGTVRDVEIYAAPMHALIDGQPRSLIVESIRDLSKQIEYSHEQKLSELGKLATGVAHEIYNPLASVRLALDGLRHGVGAPDSEVSEYLMLVDREIDKCVTFTERLLRIGMPPSDEPELVEVERIIDDTLSLVRWETKHLGITVDTDLQAGLRVLASDSQLRMVMLNLVQNAFHAMPGGGKLEVSSRDDNGWIRIAVSDSGIGIAPDRLQRIFDPFYSRRADGAKGTGLGLSIVRTIVERYDGMIDVESKPDQGSVFTVRLPDAAYEEVS